MAFTEVGRGHTYYAEESDDLPTEDILPGSVVYITDTQMRKIFLNDEWNDLPSPTVISLDDSAVTSSPAELNKLDGAGATVTAANLTELTDGSETDLHQHALADGAADVTSSAAELNKLDGASADVTAANLNALTGAGETALHSHAQLLYSATVELTNAQIKTHSSPVTLVASPGASKMLSLVQAVIHTSIVDAYSGIGADAGMGLWCGGHLISTALSNDAAVDPAMTLLTDIMAVGAKTTVLGPALDVSVGDGYGSIYGRIFATADLVDEPITYILSDIDAFGGGGASNTMTITVFYTVIDLA